MKTKLCWLVLPMVLITASFTYAQSDPKIALVEKNLVGRIQIEGEKPATIQERMAYYKIQGLSVAVIENYHLAWAKGYGWADQSLKTPVTTQTLFQAASISKSFNAIGVLKLAQDKKLDIYQDINNYLSTWKFPYDSLSKGKKITLANLLSHTAGLTGHGFEGYEQGMPLPKVVQILNGEKPANSDPIRSAFEPGLRFQYSGGGTLISQLIITDITHLPYTEYMKKTVLDPLGMTNSTFEQPPVHVKPDLLATAYDDKGKPIPGKYHIYPEQAPAGLWTNPTDLSKYIIETQLAIAGKSSKVLNQKFTKLRLTPYLNPEAALGVFINGSNTKYFNHSGSNAGFRSIYYGSMEGGNGVIVMVNSDNNNIITEVVNSIATVYGFKDLYWSTTKPRVNLSEQILKQYSGEYSLSPSFTVAVTQDGKHLYGQGTGQGKVELIPESDTSFYLLDNDVRLEFKKDETGKINSVMIYQNNHQQEAKKIK